jgi:hypothetical protein
MARKSITFVLSELPSNDEEAKRLSIDITQRYGSEEGRPAFMCALTQGRLLLGLEKEEKHE